MTTIHNFLITSQNWRIVSFSFCLGNLVPRVFRLHTPRGGEMKDPGNEVVVSVYGRRVRGARISSLEILDLQKFYYIKEFCDFSIP